MEFKSKNILNSFKYAIQGIITAIKKEKNMKIHMSIMILVIIAGIILKINPTEWILCIICFAIVISSEMINTAIENTADLITKEKNENIKNIKDIAAGAVLVSAIASSIIGLIIFIPKII